MQLHYQIAGSFKPNAHLIGSETIKTGVKLYEECIPPEEEKDFKKPQRDKSLPYWVVPDTNGKLKGLLHTCRRFELCRDVIILLSETTTKEYIAHLKERNYTYHIVGKTQINLKNSLELLYSDYKVKKVLADTGRVLGNLLIKQGFVSSISLLIHPVIVGKESTNMFANLSSRVNLRLTKREFFPGGYTWLFYNLSSKF
jgi:2,5-diamino-6-(ribosylamino)-4(3H)-pyrimidinone 5'-phosphate reductase